MFEELVAPFLSESFVSVYKIGIALYPIWLPLILGFAFMQVWLRYIRTDFIARQGKILLEIRLPKVVTKSPAAMELFFTALYQTGSASYINTFYDGKVRPWFSAELVSLGGDVHFYIWAWKKYRNIIEAQLYAQYPDLEIFEVEDYSLAVKHDPKTVLSWATYFKYVKESAYPIKTYVDYGLDKDPDEEVKIDPMTSTLEYLGSLKKGEQAWIQILFQAHRKEGIVDGNLGGKKFWKEASEKKKKELVDKLRPESLPDAPKLPSRPPTKGETDVINAIERSMHKIPFEVVIRGFYIAPVEIFNHHLGIAGLIGSLRQYNSDELNGFKLGWFTDFDYPWQDFRRIRRNKMEKQMLEAYKRRSIFQPPFRNFEHAEDLRMIMTTEELATIFHIPGQVAQTPSLARIPSKKATPPINLPI